MTWDNLRGSGVDAAPSPLDSNRFDLRVVRGTARHDEDDATSVGSRLHAALAPLDPDIAVVRWPARLSGVAEGLVNQGWTVLPADTLVYWARPVVPLSPARFPENEFDVVTAEALGSAGSRRIGELVRDTFRSYPTHYTASSVFDSSRVLEGYVEWAATAARERASQCVVVRSGPDLAAVATTSLVEDGTALEVVLAGTAPRHRGRGVYRRLLAGVEVLAADLGVERLLISTQASNVAVQRAWSVSAFFPVAAFTTVHVRRREVLAQAGSLRHTGA